LTVTVAPPLPPDTVTEAISPPVAFVVAGEPEYCTPPITKVYWVPPWPNVPVSGLREPERAGVLNPMVAEAPEICATTWVDGTGGAVVVVVLVVVEVVVVVVVVVRLGGRVVVVAARFPAGEEHPAATTATAKTPRTLRRRDVPGEVLIGRSLDPRPRWRWRSP
jgi:hypothetical protein